MPTHCSPEQVRLRPLGGRNVVADFEGGAVTSDAGVLLAAEVSKSLALFERLADCFDDQRDPRFVKHPLPMLLAQRVLGIACGYEDLVDHDFLRHDPMFAIAVGRTDLKTTRKGDPKSKPMLAGHATLNRIETGAAKGATRSDLKIVPKPEAIQQLLLEVFRDSYDDEPDEIILDLDATDDKVHGNQEGRFFHGYYGAYCYLPLYIFAGDHLLAATLRPANQDGAAGALEEVQRIIGFLRTQWKNTRFVVRADSGFCRDALLTWCEATAGVDYVIGLARNSRLQALIVDDLDDMEDEARATERAERRYVDLTYSTVSSWNRERRVVAKAECLVGKRNPRFIVTSMEVDEIEAEPLYADVYCARGEMENRIKEQQLGLHADRTSAHAMASNQLRLWFASFAYVVLDAVRRIALKGTALARAQVWTIRERLLKVGAVVTVSVRRIRIAISSAYPTRALFVKAARRLVAWEGVAV